MLMGCLEQLLHSFPRGDTCSMQSPFISKERSVTAASSQPDMGSLEQDLGFIHTGALLNTFPLAVEKQLQKHA